MQEGPSPLEAAVEQVGDRWTLLVVEALLPGPRRFSDLMEELPGIAPNILSQRLKHLESRGLVVGRPYSWRPPRVMYELSSSGRDLAGVLRLLSAWGAGRGEGESPRHPSCGTVLEARWYCPTCAGPVEEEHEDLRFL